MTPLAWVLGFVLPACGAEGAAGLPAPTPMDMTRIERPATPNTFLAGPAGMKPEPDMVIPDAVIPDAVIPDAVIPDAVIDEQPRPASVLYDVVRTIFGGQPRTYEAAEFRDRLQVHYVVRSALMNYPDLVTVQVNATGGDSSALVVWSRSVYGRNDFGVNRDRTKAWLAALQQSKER